MPPGASGGGHFSADFLSACHPGVRMSRRSAAKDLEIFASVTFREAAFMNAPRTAAVVRILNYYIRKSSSAAQI
jgi:hypothetical protein